MILLHTLKPCIKPWQDVGSTRLHPLPPRLDIARQGLVDGVTAVVIVAAGVAVVQDQDADLAHNLGLGVAKDIRFFPIDSVDKGHLTGRQVGLHPVRMQLGIGGHLAKGQGHVLVLTGLAQKVISGLTTDKVCVVDGCDDGRGWSHEHPTTLTSAHLDHLQCLGHGQGRQDGPDQMSHLHLQSCVTGLGLLAGHQ